MFFSGKKKEWVEKKKPYKRLYLTIDDAPSADMVAKVDYLLGKNIPAIWFCVGKNMKNNPDSVIYAIKKGFIIGNHSYSHTTFSQISLDEAKKEIKKTEELIDNLYQKANVKRKEKLFRFPLGDKGVGLSPFKNLFRRLFSHFNNIQQYLNSTGFTKLSHHDLNTPFPASLKLTDVDVYWTFCAREWAIFDSNISDISKKEDVLKRLSILKTRGKDEIFLIHDEEKTTKLFFEIISSLIKMDFLFMDCSLSS